MPGILCVPLFSSFNFLISPQTPRILPTDESLPEDVMGNVACKSYYIRNRDARLQGLTSSANTWHCKCPTFTVSQWFPEKTYFVHKWKYDFVFLTAGFAITGCTLTLTSEFIPPYASTAVPERSRSNKTLFSLTKNSYFPAVSSVTPRLSMLLTEMPISSVQQSLGGLTNQLHELSLTLICVFLYI